MTTRTCQEIEKGQDEIRACANHLDQRHCMMLLVVNGERTCDDTLVQSQPLGMTQVIFDESEGGGYIRPHLASNTTMKAVLIDKPAPAPASTSAVPTVPSKEPAVEGYQRLYCFYTGATSRYPGLHGYLLEMKVEKAGNVAEPVTLRGAFKTALSKTRGEPETSNMIVQLDLLIDEATG